MKNKKEKGTPSPNRTVKYSFRLTEEENISLCKMAEAAGCSDNKSRFIVGKLLDWTFHVVKKDLATEEIVTRLRDYYYQFLRIGNNYNQTVKTFHTRFTPESADARLAKLTEYTRQLRDNAEEILRITKQLQSQYDR